MKKTNTWQLHIRDSFLIIDKQIECYRFLLKIGHLNIQAWGSELWMATKSTFLKIQCSQAARTLFWWVVWKKLVNTVIKAILTWGGTNSDEYSCLKENVTDAQILNIFKNDFQNWFSNIPLCVLSIHSAYTVPALPHSPNLLPPIWSKAHIL